MGISDFMQLKQDWGLGVLHRNVLNTCAGKRGGVVRVPRFEVTDVAPEAAMLGTWEGLTARTFINPGGIGFGRMVWTRDVSAPATESMAFECRVGSWEFGMDRWIGG